MGVAANKPNSVSDSCRVSLMGITDDGEHHPDGKTGGEACGIHGQYGKLFGSKARHDGIPLDSQARAYIAGKRTTGGMRGSLA